MMPTDSDLCKTMNIFSFTYSAFLWNLEAKSAQCKLQGSDHPLLSPTSVNAAEDPQQHVGSVIFLCAQQTKFQIIDVINIWVFLHLQGNNISINTGSVNHS